MPTTRKLIFYSGPKTVEISVYDVLKKTNTCRYINMLKKKAKGERERERELTSALEMARDLTSAALNDPDGVVDINQGC